jgi:SAM-dependent methyltransferase
MEKTRDSVKDTPRPSLARWLRRKSLRWFHWPPAGTVRFGELQRMTPISRRFGLERGLCIDRYYIETFLARHQQAVRGRALEIADKEYTRRFGGDRVTQSDVLHLNQDHAGATMVSDLARGEDLPSDTFDCVILTQTLHVIYEVRNAVKTLHRILKPEGVLLATFPGISQISRYDMDRWGDYWRFTTLSAQRLFDESFGSANVSVEAYGNVLAAVAFLHGLAAGELRREELDYADPDYQVLVAVKAVKGGPG